MTSFAKNRLIGGHVSIAGGISKAIANGERLGCSAIQIFGSSPRVWYFKMPDDAEISRFLEAKKKSSIKYVVLHAIYLINLATPSKARREKAIESLVNYLNLGKRISADGVVVHVGTATGTNEAAAIKTCAAAIKSILGKTPGGIPLIPEVMAGSGNTIGARYEHLAQIIRLAGGSPRLKVCWDTAHTYASGYDLANNLDGVLKEFDRLIGLKRMSVIHLNDSKAAFNSKVDRHENLGEGKIGYEALRRIVNHPKLNRLPLIMEVPGFKGEGVDRRNMDILRKMIR